MIAFNRVASATVRALFEGVYETRKRNLSPKTRQKMRHELTRWELLSGNPLVESLGSEAFDAARDAGLARGLSPDTVETTLGTVLTILRFAKKHGEIPQVPDEGEKLIRSTRRKHVPTVADLEAAYLAVEAATWPKLGGLPIADFWRAWLVCSYFTGLRLADQMHRLRWDHLTEDSLATEASKTGKLHVFPLTSTLRRHLELLRGVDAERIFPVSKSPHRIRWELDRISTAAGLSVKLSPQALRRLAGTQWQKAKWGAGQTLLGHSLGVSDRYIAPAILQEAVRLLEVPPAFLTEAERSAGTLARDAISSQWDLLDPASRQMLAALIAKLLS